MALPVAPPRYASWAQLLSPIKQDETGWRPYALQAALRSAGHKEIVLDGAFGSKTFAAVKAFQTRKRLPADGIAGDKTQAALLSVVSHHVHGLHPRLPDGLLRGMAEAEGVNRLAATNWYSPPGGRPGVDCGPVQWRQYGPPFDMAGLRDAFRADQAFIFASRLLLMRIDDYNRRRPSLSDAMVLRIAVLAHNAPFLSDQIVRNGHLSTPNALAVWTNKPGGDHYTHAEWLQAYPDRVMKYVS